MFDAHHKSISTVFTLDFFSFRMAVVYEKALVEILEHIVKKGDHLNRKVNELVVKLSVIVLQMGPLYFEQSTFHEFELVQLIAIYEFSQSLSLCCSSSALEVHEEAF